MHAGIPQPTPDDTAATVRLTIPAKAEYISLCRLALTGLAQLRPLPAETLGDLKLALTEACSNSVRHAYVEGGTGTVEIRYRLLEDRVVVDVIDDGKGFDPLLAGAQDDELSEGGLGIAIIRALSDELELEDGGNGTGSRLRFVKFL